MQREESAGGQLGLTLDGRPQRRDALRRQAVATVVSVADALTTKVLRLTAEGGELRAAAAQHRETVQELRSRLSTAEISAEQSKQASRDAQSKPYQHRCNVRKRKHGAGEEDCEARRRDKLEQCLTTMFGAKWEEYYKNDGTHGRDAISVAIACG
eukprot:jgi/Tetstr1/427322/TSEL_017491.t1